MTTKLEGLHERSCSLTDLPTGVRWFADDIVQRDFIGRKLRDGAMGYRWLRMRCNRCGKAAVLVRFDSISTAIEEQGA
jgi:hypothetical protein